MRLCFSRYLVHGWGTLGRPMGDRRERSCRLWATEYEEHGVAMKMKSYCPEAVADTSVQHPRDDDAVIHVIEEQL